MGLFRSASGFNNASYRNGDRVNLFSDSRSNRDRCHRSVEGVGYHANNLRDTHRGVSRYGYRTGKPSLPVDRVTG